MEKNNSGLERFHYEQSLNRVMKLPSICLFGFAYLAPCTIFTTYGLVTSSTHGMLALSYLLATVGMLFTALSYRHMVRAYPIAGSVYAYTQRALNPHIGFLSGWAILMDYLLLPVINYVAASLYIPQLIPALPSWACILILIGIVTVVNSLGIKSTSSVNNVLILLQVLFIIVVFVQTIRYIISGGGCGSCFDPTQFFNAAEFGKDGVGMAAIFGGASLLALSFLGFDSVTTIAEEAIEPEKNVGRALIIICLTAGGVFILLAYLMQCAWPEGFNNFANADTASTEYLTFVGGVILANLFVVIYFFACLASAIASQASAARILFGMGRDGLLPKKIFGYVSKKTKVPTYNILIISVISLVGLVMSLEAVASFVNFGALLGFTLVNISVIAHYWVRNKERGNAAAVKYLVLPILGACVTGTIWWNLTGYAKALGFAWLAVGFIYLLITTNGFKKLPPEMDLKE